MSPVAAAGRKSLHCVVIEGMSVFIFISMAVRNLKIIESRLSTRLREWCQR